MITPSLMKQYFSFNNKLKILVIGDIIVDKYYYGVVSRISPEASIPVFNVKSCELSPGGAANVARNFVELGADVTLVGIVDRKENGRFIKRYFESIATCRLASIGGVSETKIRFIDQNHNLVGCRLDYVTSKPSSEVINKLYIIVQQCLKNNYDAIIISDYDKGCLTDNIIYLLKNVKGKFFIDCKPSRLLNYNFSHNAQVIFKPNEREFLSAGGKLEGNNLIIAESHYSKLNFKELVVTRGINGLSILSNNEQIYIAGRKVPIYNIVGAGDTILAVYSYFRLLGLTPKTAGEIANIAASEAIKVPGTSLVNRESLIKEVLKNLCLQESIHTKN